MRVTNRMTTGIVLNNLEQNLNKLQSLQNQMSSGKLVSKPSDNPVKAAQILFLKTDIALQECYANNMDEALGLMEGSEKALSNISNIMQRVRELVVYGAGSTLSPADRDALGAEVNQIIDEIIQSANTNFGSKYVFGGQLTTKPPFEKTTLNEKEVVRYLGNDGNWDWEVASGVTTTVNINGQECFQVDTNGVSEFFNVLFNVRDSLYQSNLHDLSGQCLQQLDETITHILKMQVTLGAKSNRLTIAKDRNIDFDMNMRNLLSKQEDVDLAKITMEFKMQEYVYQAALATTAQIIQPSLLSFLR